MAFDETFKDKFELREENVEAVKVAALNSDLPSQFEVLSIIGEGGMGTVYKCRNKYTERAVAIKVLNGKFDQIAQQRFQQEARAACALTHENAVTVHDFGMTASGMPYLVMEWADGQSLSSMIEERSVLPEKLVAQIFIGVCAALEAAHELGIIHRDIKPSNLVILTKPDGAISVKVLDFGIAKILGEDKAQAVTRTGEVFGSPLYMSPEQCAGNSTDLRSDIYSVGASMYECLLGSPPHAASNAMQTIFRRATEDAPTFKQARPDLKLSSTIESIVLKAVARDPSARFESVSLLKDALIRCKNSPANAKEFVQPKTSENSSDPQELLRRKKILKFTAAGVLICCAVTAWLVPLALKHELTDTTTITDDKVEIKQAGADFTLDNLRDAGMSALMERKFGESIAKFTEAVAYAKKTKVTDAPTLFVFHDKLAYAYSQRRNDREEENELREAIRLTNEPTLLADLNRRLGHNYLFSNQVEKSLPILLRSLEISTQNKLTVQSVLTQNEISYAYLLLSRYKECAEVCTAELADVRTLRADSKIYECTALQRRGLANFKLHDYALAIADSKESVRVGQSLNPAMVSATLKDAQATIDQAEKAL